MNLYPLRMNPIDPKNTEAAIREIERYLRYMVERGDWFSVNVTKEIDGLKQGGEGNGTA